ncbi:unnamed protein product [Moneuplotes crassus]|uniref:Uncharacterized protein n=1 Tax=Euplotes crassus TaxID=5936 RepID=A0AAD2D3C2_EUPCR|nr:unnamed protein product [Moneuplotes crassus]
MKRNNRRADNRKDQTEPDVDYAIDPSNSGVRTVNLTVARSAIEDREEQEVIPEVTVYYDEHNNIKLGPLVEGIRKMGYKVDRSMISYYDEERKVYVYAGNHPLPDKAIPNIPEGEIKIKARPKAKSIYGDFLLANTNASISKGSRRTKERKIGDVIKKVSEWRKLYNGTEIEGEIVKKSLEEAAKLVNISKKSLDDYLLQLRNGRKYGFNFNEHKDDKIGILRAFNRKHKLIDKGTKKSKPGRKPGNR